MEMEMETQTETRQHPNNDEVKVIYKRYPSQIIAQKKYYDKMKNNEAYKEIQNKSSKNYYQKNKTQILEKMKAKYKLMKDEQNQNIN